MCEFCKNLFSEKCKSCFKIISGQYVNTEYNPIDYNVKATSLPEGDNND